MKRREITVFVTQDDIDKGRWSGEHWYLEPDGPHCPLDYALSRATGQDCVTDAYDWHVVGDVFSNRVLPSRAQEFVRAFDAEEDIEPFQFEVLVRHEEA